MGTPDSSYLSGDTRGGGDGEVAGCSLESGVLMEEISTQSHAIGILRNFRKAMARKSLMLLTQRLRTTHLVHRGDQNPRTTGRFRAQKRPLEAT